MPDQTTRQRDTAARLDYIKQDLADATRYAQDAYTKPQCQAYTVLYKGSACSYRFIELNGPFHGYSSAHALDSHKRPLSDGDYIVIDTSGNVSKFRRESVTTHKFRVVSGF